MNNLQMLKKAMLAYVSAVKFVWSAIAYPLSIVGKKLMNLRGYRVYGNSVQDGTPTPDSPVEIECVGDLSTKNLFDIDTFNTTAPTVWIKYNKTTGIITCNYGVYANGLFFHSNIETLKAGTYTMSCEVLYDPVSSPYTSDMYMGVCGYDENGTRKVYSKGISVSDATAWTKKTVTINVETDIDMSDASSTGIGIEIQPNGGSQKYLGLNLQIRNVMIAEGDVNDDYEPYHKYKIPVVAKGKNMATAQQVYFNAKNYSECIEDGRNCIRCTSDGTSYAGINFISNTQYTVRFEAKTVARSGHEGDTSGEALFAFTHTDGTRKLIAAKGSKDWTYYEVTSFANKTIASVGMYPYNYKHWIYINVDTFQIEEGTTATTKEPYIEPITKNIYLDEPLRKVGDYADYVDFERQKVVRNIYQYNLSEISALGNFYDKTTYWYGYWHIREPYPISINKLKIISDKFKCIYPRNADVEDTYLSNDVPPYNSAMYYSVEKKYCPEVETIAEMLDWLRGTNADLFYVLATPIEETVNLPALPQFKGTTIYEVQTNTVPSGMEAKYC